MLLLTGTGAVGSENWTLGPNFRATLLRAGHSSCYLNFPDFTTGDIQTAAEYVVNGIRVMSGAPGGGSAFTESARAACCRAGR